MMKKYGAYKYVQKKNSKMFWDRSACKDQAAILSDGES